MNIDTLEIHENHTLSVQKCIDEYIKAGYIRNHATDVQLGLTVTSARKTVDTRYGCLQKIMNSAVILKKICMGFHAGELFGQLPEELNKWIKNSLYSRQVCAELETLKMWLSKKSIRRENKSKYITEEHNHPGSVLKRELLNGGYKNSFFDAQTAGEAVAAVMRRNPLTFISHERAAKIEGKRSLGGLGLRSSMPKNWDGENVFARPNAAEYRIVPLLLHKLAKYNVHLLSGHEDVRKAIDQFSTQNAHLSIDEMIAELTRS